MKEAQYLESREYEYQTMEEDICHRSSDCPHIPTVLERVY